MKRFSIVFPGQGSQFVEMGLNFYKQSSVAKNTFEEASDAWGKSVQDLCFSPGIGKLWDFTNMQVAIVTTSVAMYRSFIAENRVLPNLLFGHSLGEYSALVCSGALKLSDCIHLLQKRGELVQEVADHTQGSMAIVENVPLDQLINILNNQEEYVSISCFNSESQYAISGTEDALDNVEERILELGGLVSPLISSPPMHSQLMGEAVNEFQKELRKVSFFNFSIPVVSNVTGKIIEKVEEVPELMARQLVNPVLWHQSIEYGISHGSDLIIEMSPKILLSNLEKKERGTQKNNFYCYGVKKDEIYLNKYFSENIKDKISFSGLALRILASIPDKQNDEAYFSAKQSYKQILAVYKGQKEDRKQVFDLLMKGLKNKELSDWEMKSCIKEFLDCTGSYYEFIDVYRSL